MTGGEAAGDPLEVYKQEAAERAVEFVQSGMLVGLGTGSTAIYAIRRIGALLREGHLRELLCFATSTRSAAAARELGIPLLPEDNLPELDLTIDGADEVDPDLNLIKGGGGALTREKIVAQSTRREVIVVDATKPSPVLGTRRALPVEVIPFGWRAQARYLEALGAKVTLRQGADGAPFRTDQGNYVVDCAFGPIANAAALATAIAGRAGLVEHGLFLGLAHDLIVAGPNGIEHRTRGG